MDFYSQRDTEVQGNKLYVGNLTYSVDDEQLKELFSKFGEVKSVRVIEGKGFGFVEMGSQGDAVKAKEGLDGQAFEGRTLRVNEARPPKPKPRMGYGR